jgi:hypothetical protein
MSADGAKSVSHVHGSHEAVTLDPQGHARLRTILMAPDLLPLGQLVRRFGLFAGESPTDSPFKDSRSALATPYRTNRWRIHSEPMRLPIESQDRPQPCGRFAHRPSALCSGPGTSMPFPLERYVGARRTKTNDGHRSLKTSSGQVSICTEQDVLTRPNQQAGGIMQQ